MAWADTLMIFTVAMWQSEDNETPKIFASRGILKSSIISHEYIENDSEMTTNDESIGMTG